MGMNTEIKNKQIIDNAYGILGIEFMAAAQALDFRDHKTGKGTSAQDQRNRFGSNEIAWKNTKAEADYRGPDL